MIRLRPGIWKITGSRFSDWTILSGASGFCLGNISTKALVREARLISPPQISLYWMNSSTSIIYTPKFHISMIFSGEPIFP